MAGNNDRITGATQSAATEQGAKHVAAAEQGGTQAAATEHSVFTGSLLLDKFTQFNYIKLFTVPDVQLIHFQDNFPLK